MPLLSVRMRPGINTQRPLLANEGFYSTSQLVRFKDGQAQAMGGWTRWWPAQLDSPPRQIESWGDLNGTPHTAVGTDTSIYVIDTTGQQDITPITKTTDPTVNFSTVNTSKTVTIIDNAVGTVSGSSINLVTAVSVGGIVLQGLYPTISITGADSFTIAADTAATSTVANGGAVPSFATTSGQIAVTVTLDNHGLSIGQAFPVPVSTPVGGIVLFGTYLVQSVTNSNQFVIDAASAATSTASVSLNGGDAEITYYGVPQQDVVQGGYGVGGYGGGPYGQGGTAGPVVLPTVPLFTFDNWGQTLVIGVYQGAIFTWTPNSGEAEAQLILNAPPVNGGVFIAQPQLVLVAWGSSVGGVQQPLLVQWSGVGDYTVWQPSVENQAGNYTIPSGSRIMGALQGPQQALIWTDIDVYTMNYLGSAGNTELAWGFLKLADHCGLLAFRAACVLDDAVFWLAGPEEQAPSPQPSGGRFMIFAGGAVLPIPCPVWDEIFQDLDWANVEKIVAAPNSLFHEVAWFYPSLSGGTGECDSYVKFNKMEGEWDYGKLPRTAWQDYSVAGNPLGGGADGYLYQHEVGTSANGQPLEWSLGTGAIMLAQGNEMSFVDWVLPEFQWGMKNAPASDQPVNVTVGFYRFANDAAPYTESNMLFSATGNGFGNPRGRGRHMTIQYSGQGFARIGDVRIRVAPDGRYG